ncbi:MAG: glycine radical domain-containing protein [Bacteroidota bacterium]
MLGLIRTYFSLGGIQLQLSAVTPEQLEAAVREPDQHRDLVVRVAGYCDYARNTRRCKRYLIRPSLRSADRVGGTTRTSASSA